MSHNSNSSQLPLIDRIKPTDGQLTNEEQREIDAEIELYPQASAACIEALKVVQKHRGWVADNMVTAIANYLGMSSAEVDSVATFYNLIYRRPVGKQVISFCNSVSCWLTGGTECRKRISNNLGVEFGETTQDGEYTLLPITCLGACDKAPVMLVGETLHTQLSMEKIDQLFSPQYEKADKESNHVD